MTEQRFNPNHAPAGSAGGGQFTSGGGGGGGKTPAAKKTAPASHSGNGGHGHTTHGHHGHSRHTHAAGPLKTTLSYNPKTNRGAGYGTRNGDPHVHDVQRALNRLGFTDLHGKKLVDDGKLGPLTTSSIKNAQKALGLKQDGLLTPALYQKLLTMKAPHHTPQHHGHGHGHAPHRTHPHHRSGELEPMETRAAVQTEDPNAAHYLMTDDDCDAALDEHLAGLDDDGVKQLGAAAEEMHGEGY